jgi:uncharacterized membrane protein
MGKIGRHLRGKLIVGLFVAFPIAITYILLRWVFIKTDNILQPFLISALGMEIKGLGLVSLIIIMYFLGLIMSLRIGRRIIRTFQAYLINVPVIGTLYGPAKQLVESFSGDSAAGFKRVVVVEYPKADTWMIGFLTGISEVNPGTTMGVVYLPTAPTPNSGWVAMIPIQQIYDTSMSVSEAMTMVLSGGISSPLGIALTAMDPSEASAFVEEGGRAATQQFNENSGVFNLPGIRQQQDSDQR